MRSGIIAKRTGHDPHLHRRGRSRARSRCSRSRAVRSSRIARRRGRYVALQVGIGRDKVKNVSKAERGRFAVAQVEPKLKLAEFRVAEDKLIPVGAEITADHFARRPICRCHRRHARQGLRRTDEALELRRFARHARRLGLAPFAGSTGGRRTPARPGRTRRWRAIWASIA